MPDDPLDPELKTFIDRVIIPALVERLEHPTPPKPTKLDERITPPPKKTTKR